MGERGLTVRDRIIVHLADFNRHANDYECPFGMCQAGISEAIGKSRAHTTLEINRMRQDGLLSERLARVKDARSKRKTYALTPMAIMMEKQISEHLDAILIDIVESGNENQVNGTQAVNILTDKLSLSKVMAFDMVMNSGGRLDIDEILKSNEQRAHIIQDMPADLDPACSDGGILRANLLSKQGRHREALEMLGKNMPHTPEACYSRAAILRKSGDLASALKEINRAIDSGPDGLHLARCWMEKAMILHGSGHARRSLELLDSASDSFKREESQVDLLRCGINRAIVLRSLGDMEKARQCLEASLSLARKTGIERLKAYVLVNLSDLLNQIGEHESARDSASNAAEIFRVLNEPLMLAAALFNRGTARAALGENDGAIKDLDGSISVLEKNNMLASRASWLENYADMLERMGQDKKAADVLGKL